MAWPHMSQIAIVATTRSPHRDEIIEHRTPRRNQGNRCGRNPCFLHIGYLITATIHSRICLGWLREGVSQVRSTGVVQPEETEGLLVYARGTHVHARVA